MTSNVRELTIMEVTTNFNAYNSEDEAYQVTKFHVTEAVREKYRPELINHIDEFIVFQPFSPKQICEIVKLHVFIHSLQEISNVSLHNFL